MSIPLTLFPQFNERVLNIHSFIVSTLSLGPLDRGLRIGVKISYGIIC